MSISDLIAPSAPQLTPDAIELNAHLLDALGHAVIATDLQGTIRFWSRTAERLYGWTAPEVLGRNVTDVTPAPLSETEARDIMSRLAAGEMWTGEFSVRRKDGTTFLAQVTDTPVYHEGRLIGVVGVSVDVSERRRLEDEARAHASSAAALAASLAAREERLRAALHASGTGTFRWDIRTNALEWDESLDRLFGLEPGRTARSLDQFVALVHPEDRERVVTACARCATTGADFDEEFRVVWPDGTVHWLDDKGRTFCGADGQPAYMTGACVETTNRKRADQEHERLLEALRASEARLRRIMESGIVGVFFWSLSGTIVEANDSFLQLLGFSRDDLAAGRIDWRALTPCEWAAADAEKVQELLDTGRHGPYEKEYFAKDGRRVPLLVASAFFEGSRTDGVALCIDLSARRAAEDALWRQHALSNALSAALHEEDIARVVLEQAVPLIGATGAGVLLAEGEELRSVGWLGYDPAVMQPWSRYSMRTGTPGGDAALSGEPVFLEDRAAWVARYPQWLEWVLARGFEAYAGIPMRLEGRVLGVLAFNFPGPHAFTAQERETMQAFAQQAAQAFERARLLREASEARAEAEVANRAKSAFLATMSHELRTPLNAIGGYTDLIEMGIRGPVTEAQREDLARIRRSQSHLLGLINDVLEFAKIDAGAVHFQMRDVPLAEAIAGAEAMVMPQMGAKDLRYVPGRCDPALRVRADADKLRQILLNLLGNAIKFTGRGGRIAMSCEARESTVAITVHDTGIGIPAARLESIFEPFVQLDRTFARTNEGVGLGLPISRELARGMGGELVAASVDGAGSSFTLTLQRSRE